MLLSTEFPRQNYSTCWDTEMQEWVLMRHGLGNMNENGQRLLELCNYHELSQTLSLKTNHVAKCPGDIPGQVIGTNLTSSSPGVSLSTTSSTHAAAAARPVTLISP